MSAYRDQLNPEAVHFPGRISTRVLLVVLVGVLFLLSLAVAITRASIERKAIEIAVLAASAIFVLLFWPPEIVTDQLGIRQHRLLRLGLRHLRWEEVVDIRRDAELFGLFGSRTDGLQTIRIVVAGAKGRPRVVHSSLHSDPERFLKETERRSGLTVS